MANIKNLAADFVVTPPSPAISGTTLTVRSGAGQTFPPTPFYATATSPNQLSTQGTSEIVLVTTRSVDTMTIIRAQKGTTAQSIGANWVFVNGIYAEDINNSTIVLDELLTPAANGTNKVFTTASPFTAILPYKNGVTMHQGASYDFTVTGTNQITYNTAPPNGANLTATYVIGNQVNLNGSNSLIVKESVKESPDGTIKTFTTLRSYVGGSLEVFVNGLNKGNKVVETNPLLGTFTLDTAPASNTDIQVSYQYAVTATFNADTVDGINASTTPTPNQLLALNSRGQSGEWWEELGRVVLSSNGNIMSVTLPVTKKYLKILSYVTQTGGTNTNEYIRFNNDGGTNYDHRTLIAGATNTLSTAQTGIYGYGDTNAQSNGEWTVFNISNQNKVVFGKRQVTYPNGGSGLTWVDISGAWRNSTDSITSVQYLTTTANFVAGSELIILGHN